MWRQRISPVLDTAMRFQLVDVEDGREAALREVPLEDAEQVGRLRMLTDLGVDVVICCAVSRRLQVELESCGVRVLAHTCGAVSDVIAAYLQNRLTDEAFRMPGCRKLPDCTRNKVCGEAPAATPSGKRKIAFTADAPNLDAPLARHFGRCAYFLVIDPDTGVCEAHANIGSSARESASRIDAASKVTRLGVHTVVSGNIGPRARATLERARVQVVTGPWPTVRSAIDAGSPKDRE